MRKLKVSDINRSYRLFRKRITIEDRKNWFYYPESTHLIAIEVMIFGDKWACPPMDIQPKDLKIHVEKMLSEIVIEYNRKHQN